jgi:hypothetical protein
LPKTLISGRLRTAAKGCERPRDRREVVQRVV